MDLQNTFYVLGIIVMSLTLIILIALVIAVFAIRAKINAIHRTIEQKLNLASNVARAGASIFEKAKEAGAKLR